MAMAAVLPFSFFIAYGVMSIPAGFLIERWGEKRSMLAALCVAFLGALAFARPHVCGRRRFPVRDRRGHGGTASRAQPAPAGGRW